MLIKKTHVEKISVSPQHLPTREDWQAIFDKYGSNCIIEDISLDECRKLYQPATELTYLDGEVTITIAICEPVTLEKLNEHFPYSQVDHEPTGPLSEVW